jgi:hypothetical protein
VVRFTSLLGVIGILVTLRARLALRKGTFARKNQTRNQEPGRTKSFETAVREKTLDVPRRQQCPEEMVNPSALKEGAVGAVGAQYKNLYLQISKVYHTEFLCFVSQPSGSL